MKPAMRPPLPAEKRGVCHSASEPWPAEQGVKDEERPLRGLDQRPRVLGLRQEVVKAVPAAVVEVQQPLEVVRHFFQVGQDIF